MTNRFLIIGLVLLASAAPAVARDKMPPAQPPAPVIPQAHSGDPSVDFFYSNDRKGAVLWLASEDGRMAARRLVDVLRRAPIDGLADGPVLAAGVEQALLGGTLDDDARISAAYVRYAKAMGAPVAGMEYGDPVRKPVEPSAAQALRVLASSPSLAVAVDALANPNSLYVALRDTALAKGLGSDPRVLSTLARLRLVPGKGRAVVVDIPSSILMMMKDGQVVDQFKVIVGKPSGATPVLASTIHYVTFNPYWHIPPDIARVRVAPVVVKRGVGYLKLARYQAVAAFGGDKEVPIDPTTVDWKAVAAGTEEAHVRQLAGPQNMMGRMKIGFNNPYGVFLHDTPNKKLFDKKDRLLSHGCIRMEKPDYLATWLLGREARPPSDDSELNVQIDEGVPVYLTYITAQPAADGTIAFASDVYGLETPGATKAVIGNGAD